MPERGQFTFYRSYYEAVKAIPKRDQLAVLMAICAYALDGEEPELSGFPAAAFALVRTSLDLGRNRAESGKRGGQAKSKQNGSKTEANEKQIEICLEQNGKQNESTEKKEKSPLSSPLSSPPTPPTSIPPIIPPKEKEKGSAALRFAPPTVDEVRAYCLERGNSVDPARFVDFYTCKGWMVGKTKMKDWKAAVRTWEHKNAEASTPPQEETTRPKKHWVATGPFDGYWEEDG